VLRATTGKIRSRSHLLQNWSELDLYKVAPAFLGSKCTGRSARVFVLARKSVGKLPNGLEGKISER
jgi:hypothetical protein